MKYIKYGRMQAMNANKKYIYWGIPILFIDKNKWFTAALAKLSTIIK